MNAFADSRRWWPDFVMDETMPEGRKRPQDWLAPDESAVTTVLDDDEATVLGVIKPGEIIGFHWHEKRGGVQVLIMPDGSWSLDNPRDAGTVDMFDGSAAAPVDEPPMALVAAANWFAEITDYETMADSMDEFALNWTDMAAPLPKDGERVAVAMGFWSEKMSFRVSDDGKSLENVEMQNGGSA